MNNITVNTFLNTLFPPDLLLPDERPAIAYPDSFRSRGTGKLVEYYRQMHPVERMALTGKSTYFCVSTVQRQRARQIKKRLEDVRTAWVLVLDDIGSKSKPPRVPPSYQLETSEGNYQWGYLIEPYDVSTPEGQAYYDTALYVMAEAGHNDPGFRSASRLARMPGSVHRTGWIARLTDWNPQRSWDLESLMADFQVPLVTPRVAKALKPGKWTDLADVEDPVLDWLQDNGQVLGHNDQWVFIECPWRDTHTGGAQGASSTAYSPADYGREGVGFKCLHGHCVKRGVDDLLTFVAQEINA